ncbi:conjugative transfer signal peptidase TraF [Massilia psychrophila]|uniref:Conjugative transfer signal peptidase TraF n=1 Tax=Massilia psychrophila TaxID=1603353 RepID=A0A2G8SYN1_9BURK|nr:conjugative transfer signal peptidase TraF [Massilia psychrophila]PIL38854.1 conjugative transfer signal peptidase TraF [Massilia psychrophila]GGE90603.1 conjugal transfer protein TraF [Massilia psychrophila]
MKPLLVRAAVAVSLVGAGVIALGLLCHVVGARINTSKSIPLGLYWTSNGPAEKGAYVIFCPPQVGVIAEAKRRGYLSAGFCPGDYGYMMKKILAAKGDRVTIAGEGVRVNGALLPLSAPLAHDRVGRALPRFQSDRSTLGSNDVLLMSTVSGTSFDARYFGPVGRSQIRSVIVPVVTW